MPATGIKDPEGTSPVPSPAKGVRPGVCWAVLERTCNLKGQSTGWEVTGDLAERGSWSKGSPLW